MSTKLSNRREGRGSGFRGKLICRFLAVNIVTICTLVPLLWIGPRQGGAKKIIHIEAKKYAYSPPRITVNLGDEVHIRLSSLDVIHGFYLEGYDVDALIEPGKKELKVRHPSSDEEYSGLEEIVFVANRPGKFHYRCSHTCGFLHPFMLGELIVEPNYLFPMAVGLIFGILIGGFVLVWPFSSIPSRTGESLPPRD